MGFFNELAEFLDVLTEPVNKESKHNDWVKENSSDLNNVLGALTKTQDKIIDYIN